MQINTNKYNEIFPVVYKSDEEVANKLEELNQVNNPSDEIKKQIVESLENITQVGIVALLMLSNLGSPFNDQGESTIKKFAKQQTDPESATPEEQIAPTLRLFKEFPLAEQMALTAIHAVETLRRNIIVLKNEDSNDVRQTVLQLIAKPLWDSIKFLVVKHYVVMNLTSEKLGKQFDPVHQELEIPEFGYSNGFFFPKRVYYN